MIPTVPYPFVATPELTGALIVSEFEWITSIEMTLFRDSTLTKFELLEEHRMLQLIIVVIRSKPVAMVSLQDC